ncbi:thiamine pyrophosphate-binding protein [Bordetella bronchiseptica]|uniref:thiamine pyrophosphate-binding protein n=1 Tax=Bordetella bronchiseptica TaxID=518 RepID=UPI0004594DB2|nr:thiamine pyrophosphate-binding protein [Bordetella bronchiseptica]KCV60715.1 thiamine pyrophosphate enzyme, N-terminal TPP binding domain protein [Bordetella bronchiseptica 99-R-0433]
MNPTLPARTGGRILVDALKVHGVDQAFCVPGESYLPVLDALRDDAQAVRLTVCRQEGGAAFMAEAYGKLTGKPGICFVTRGPGATNASIGVHTAFQDSTPMILFVGQVGADVVEREAFQEIDYRRMYGQMAKWVASIDDVRRIPEFVHRAHQVALSGRPGPVVLALPEDVLRATAHVADRVPHRIARPCATGADMERLRELLATARRPLLIVGGGGWNEAASAAIARYAERAGLPVATAFRRQDRFDNRHPCYAGHIGLGIAPSLARHVRQADLLLVVGARLADATTDGYALIAPEHPGQTLIHVHPDPQELGRVYPADLPIAADVQAFAAQLDACDTPPAHRGGWLRELADDYRADLAVAPSRRDTDLAQVMHWLNQHLPQDAIVTNGAGNYAGWVHRYFQYSPRRRQLAPTNGAMGYGVPAAIAAKLAAPTRAVVCFAGDGCFMMNGQELATAIQYDAAVVFIIVNNGMFGTIRMHQEMHYPGRVSGTSLRNPDFVALAKAYGAHAERVAHHDGFPAAFERACASGRTALIEIRTDPAAISARRDLPTLAA